MAKIQNDVIGPCGYGQGPFQPNFLPKCQFYQQLLRHKLERRLSLCQATQKKGRPSLRPGLNNLFLAAQKPSQLPPWDSPELLIKICGFVHLPSKNLLSDVWAVSVSSWLNLEFPILFLPKHRKSLVDGFSKCHDYMNIWRVLWFYFQKCRDVRQIICRRMWSNLWGHVFREF